LNTILRRCIALLTLVLIGSVYGLADGGADFKMRCAPCHGTRGAGDTKLGQNLKVRDLGSADVQKQSDDELVAIIRKGKGKMPAYDGKLSKEQNTSLVKYIRTLKK
jgi:mono/diheme cytochrome c family protein